ncbi:MAG: SDR family NAD(P)-dependent oxidoreductase [Deltaproteobacteria bacterium]|nr:SDR family NAD(P)-dependent oxidoreductase [Deltaproteobacteria bacterium]
MSDLVVVTGAGGFIGSHLCESLVRDGARVRALVHYNGRNDWGMLELVAPEIRRELEVVAGDIRDPFGVRAAVAGCGVVYHLAALIAIPYSYRAPQTFFETNVLGTLNVLQAALDAGVRRVVHTSTSEVYGTAREVPIPETHPLQAQSPYSASKIGADKVAESFHLAFGLPVVTVRPFNTFGPRQSARAVIPTIASQALAGLPVRLGALAPTRDLLYVADTVRGLRAAAAAEGAVGQVINLGTGREISIGDLARLILRLTGAKTGVEHDDARLRPERSEVQRLCAKVERAAELLGWRPEFTLEQGLEQVIAFLRAHPERYKPEIYNT